MYCSNKNPMMSDFCWLIVRYRHDNFCNTLILLFTHFSLVRRKCHIRRACVKDENDSEWPVK